MKEINLSGIQKQISEIYNYVSKEFKETENKKTKKILDYVFRTTHSILKELSNIRIEIKNLL